MSDLLKQSTAYTRMFLMVDSADHFTGKTGLTVTVTLSKAGGSFASAGGTVTEVSSGWYKIALTTTDTNTLGDLAYHCTATGADATDFADQVIALDLADAVRAGLTALPNATAGANTGLPVVGTQIPNATAAANGGLPTVDSTNSVKIQTPLKRNTALNNFEFLMYDTTGSPATGLTVTGTRSIDGGTPASTTNSVSEVSSGAGRYKINLSAADLNGAVITFVFSASGARDTAITIPTLP